MQPAIAIGTLLQNRYRVVQLLGQGGFGRTYLAEDQGRFNERCAIKEFVPVQGEDKFSSKATELFQREASVLYQIEHPQIPKFRATFEEEERLFLVQDYVEGPTYYEVLRQRRQNGRTFLETEVRQFLQQMLPVLAHIHAKGVIHRDVSPDNIILRQQDSLPVLIDFGVVKEVVTRMQLDGVVSHATTVGKAGYAPAEQMQTGRAYPSSDLYALAVTAVVLLTGKEPQQLFDDVNAVWTWQDTVTVDPRLAAVLNKALSFRPGDRFQSVIEMAQALRSSQASSQAFDKAVNKPSGLEDGLTGAIPGSSPLPAYDAGASPVPPMSQMKTVAVGSPVTNYGSPTAVNRPTTVRQAGAQAGAQGGAQGGAQLRGRSPENPRTRIVMPSERDRPSMLENPFAVGGLAVGLAAIAGLAGYGIVQSLDVADTPPPPITAPPPVVETEPEPEPEPIQVDPKPVEYNQPPLALIPRETKIVEGSMRQGDKVNYPFTVEAGQTLKVSQSEDDARLSVLGPDGQPVSSRANGVFEWEGVLEEGGEYIVQLSTVRGANSSDYRLSVTLSDPPVVEDPDPVDPEPPVDPVDPEPSLPPVQPELQSQRVSFPPGQDGILVANSVGPGRVRRYVVNAREGQILSAEIVDAQGGRVDFDVLMPGGEMVADASGIVAWQGLLPVGGDYAIDVQANEAAEFTLSIQATSEMPDALGQ